jgi:hypothetical protein
MTWFKAVAIVAIALSVCVWLFEIWLISNLCFDSQPGACVRLGDFV